MARRIPPLSTGCAAFGALVLGCRGEPIAPQPPTTVSRSVTAAPPTPSRRRGCAGQCPGWSQQTFDWHEAAIVSLATTSTGLISLSSDGTMRWWDDALRPRKVRALPAVGPDARLASDPAGRTVVAVVADELWRFGQNDDEPLAAPVDVGGDLKALEVRADGTVLIGHGSGRIRLLGERKQADFEIGAPLTAAITDGGTQLVVGISREEFGAVLAVDLETHRSDELRHQHPIPPVADLAFDSRGERVVSGGYELSVWSLKDHKRAASIRVGHQPSERAARWPAFSADGRTIEFVAVGGQLARWIPQEQRVERMDVDTVGISAAAWTALHVWVGTGQGSLERIPRNGSEARLVGPGVGAGVTALAFTGDSQQLAAGLDDGRVVLWDLGSRDEIGRIAAHRGEVNALVSLGNGTMVSAGADGVRIIDTHPLEGGPQLGEPIPVLALDVCAGPTIVAGQADGAMTWLDPEQPDRIRQLAPPHASAVLGIDATDDCSFVASCAEDGRIVVWDTRSEAVTATFEPGRQHPLQAVRWLDSETLVSAEAFMGQDVIRRWFLPNKTQGSPLATTKYGASKIVTQGERILVAGMAEGALFWERDDQPRTAVFPHFNGTAMAVAIADDGQHVALGTTGNEATVRVWRREP